MLILLWAVVIGFAAGLTRAIVAKRRYQAPNLHLLWLVIAAFIPQLIAFRLSFTRNLIPDASIPAILVSTQALLIIFAAINIRTPGMWLLGLGLALNFLVIIFNHGMMPISPQTVYRLLPNIASDLWSVGERLGTGKDIVLDQGATRFWILSDRFVLIFNQYRVAFSIGDVLIALGAIWILWSAGGPEPITTKQISTTKEKHHEQPSSGNAPQ